MVKHPLLASLIALTLVGTASARAADDDAAKPTKAEQRLASVMKKYDSTGEEKNCVQVSRIRDTKVIDDQTIFFDMGGQTGYMNHLPNRCARLGFERRFSYKLSTSQLCNVDIITVLDSNGQPWSSCGLGKFEVMNKKAPTTSN